MVFPGSVLLQLYDSDAISVSRVSVNFLYCLASFLPNVAHISYLVNILFRVRLLFVHLNRSMFDHEEQNQLDLNSVALIIVTIYISYLLCPCVSAEPTLIMTMLKMTMMLMLLLIMMMTMMMNMMMTMQF